jgi:hypothetical protein
MRFPHYKWYKKALWGWARLSNHSSIRKSVLYSLSTICRFYVQKEMSYQSGRITNADGHFESAILGTNGGFNYLSVSG